MADCDTTLQSPSDNKEQKKPISFPRLFTGFTLKAFSDNTEAVMSPTSILDSKPLSAFKNPWWSESRTPKTPEPETRHKLDSKGISLGIFDALRDDDLDSNLSKPVLFGSQLRIQIPSLPPIFAAAESPRTPPEFGLKTRSSQLSSFSSGLSPSPVRKNIETLNSPRVIPGSLSATEMELSEDYTCVISHGPNPRTTHIFDNCIVESCCGVVGFSSSKRGNGFLSDRSSYQSESFLSFCCTCKKNLGQGKDIYMYRGEKAFCSRECRYQEMMLEEGIEPAKDKVKQLNNFVCRPSTGRRSNRL
ncbi:protein MARD1-like isoform X2 [Durio zibethinus]|uniref:Protein MARD1-like isoform X2 n=1 Tax=Durio zibethinus TaxID=66656 RepID=A0A6P6AB13_DURZI|nr:protein MARD1-like isoform X2 [Durio zibethinus]